MSRMDITVSRSFTVNTGNYSSIKPTIDLTIKDVPIDKMSEVYLEMTSVIEGMMHNETLRCKEEMETINKGLNRYCDGVKGRLNEIGDSVENSLKEIEKLVA